MYEISFEKFKQMSVCVCVCVVEKIKSLLHCILNLICHGFRIMGIWESSLKS